MPSVVIDPIMIWGYTKPRSTYWFCSGRMPRFWNVYTVLIRALRQFDQSKNFTLGWQAECTQLQLAPHFVADDPPAWNLPCQGVMQSVASKTLLLYSSLSCSPLGLIGLKLPPLVSSWWWWCCLVPRHCCLCWWAGGLMEAGGLQIVLHWAPQLLKPAPIPVGRNSFHACARAQQTAPVWKCRAQLS